MCGRDLMSERTAEKSTNEMGLNLFSGKRIKEEKQVRLPERSPDLNVHVPWWVCRWRVICRETGW